MVELCSERGMKMENFMELHERGLEVVGRYKMSEAEVLGVLQELDKTKTYLKFNCKSLFEYSRKFHKMSEPVTLNFIAVSRRATQIPELKAAIETGELTVSTARKITSVITPESQSDWISKAINLTSRALEKEVARVLPQALAPEKIKYVREDRVNLNLGLAEEVYKKLKRVQDLEAQRQSKVVNLEETLKTMIDLYLEKKDPVEKARRNINASAPVPGHVDNFGTSHSEIKNSEKNKSGTEKKRRILIPMQLRHQINLRDQGKCSHENCDQQRWLEIHHVIPVSQGGQNTLDNLKTLCSGHHKMQHLV